MNDDTFGFDGKQPTPARPGAAALATAVLQLVRTEAALAAAQARVPSYTAQWSDRDYYATEQEAFNRAADALAEAVAAGSAPTPEHSSTNTMGVSGCADCPAHHDAVGEGEWCGLSEEVSYHVPVRDRANPQFPPRPANCPLLRGPIVLVAEDI